MNFLFGKCPDRVAFLAQLFKVDFKLEKLVNKELESKFHFPEVCLRKGPFRSSHTCKEELEGKVQDLLIVEDKSHVR